MKKILVPYDFSPAAEKAFKAAVEIAGKVKASITLMHIIEMPYSGSFVSSGTYIEKSALDDFYVVKLAEAAKAKLDSIAKSEAYNHLIIQPFIKVGSVFKHISEHIAANKFDLIIMGTKGVSGIQEILVGSNTQKVIKLVNCPVLTVKAASDKFTIENLVVATDLVTMTNGVEEVINSWKEAFGCKVHLLLVNTPSGFYSNKQALGHLEAYKEKYKLMFDHFEIYNAFTEVEGIKEYGQQVNAEVIAMVTHGRGGIAKFMSGSVCDEVINQVETPVLFFKLKDED
jgi:nucleotide-binding universal stress UspA family protein